MPDAEKKTTIDKQDPTARNFLLSICIPTYNRSSVLQKTLGSIVREKAFCEGKVEVVVSDNVSTDETPELLRAYSGKYPGRVRYFRQPNPIDPHFNYEHSMNMGTGTFLKLHGDRNYFCTGSLDRLVKNIEEHAGSGSVFLVDIFAPEKKECELIGSVEELVQKASYHITYINLLCLRRNVFHSLDDPFRAWKINFPHVDILFRLLNRGETVVCLNHIETVSETVLYGTDRNEAEIFARNYISLLHDQVTAGKLSRKTYQREKYRTLLQHTIPVHFDFFHQYNINRKPLPFWPYTKYYRRDPVFYLILLWIAFYWFTSNVIPIHQTLGKVKRSLLKK